MIEQALALTAVGAVTARRPMRLSSDLKALICAIAYDRVAPALQVIDSYAFHVCVRFPLNAWTTNAKMHPPEGVCMSVLM